MASSPSATPRIDWRPWMRRPPPFGLPLRRSRGGLDGERSRRVAAEDPDDKLAVDQRRLDPAAVALGDVDLALVAAVVPFVHQILTRGSTAQPSPEAKGPRAQFDGHVACGHR